jgi:hypothetical protein
MKGPALLTTCLEIVGSSLVIVGMVVAFGAGGGLLAAGTLCIAASWLLTTRGGSKS